MAWAEIGDIVLRYQTLGSGGRVVLLIHEMGGSIESWDYVAPALSQTNRVVMLDQRNCGLSEYRPGPLSIDQLAEDIDGLLMHLRITEPVLAVGVAVGAAVALNLASRYPKKVVAVLALSPAVTVAEERKQAARERSRLLLTEGVRPSLDTRLMSSYPPAMREDASRFAMIRLRRAAAGALGMSTQTAMLADLNISEALARISCPVTCIAGTFDGDRPPKAVRDVASAIPGAKYREVPSGHFMPLQTPDLVLDLLADILAALSPRPHEANRS